MEARICRRCKRMYMYVTGENICSNCREDLEKKFEEVKEYLREHRNVTIKMISEECEIETRQIEKWIEEDRLEFSSVRSEKFCQKCGAPIVAGTYCVNCKSATLSALSNSIKTGVAQEEPKSKPAPKSSTGGKMFTYGR